MEISNILHRIRFIAFIVFSMYLFFGVLVPIGYLVMGNYDPKTWIFIYDQFLLVFF